MVLVVYGGELVTKRVMVAVAVAVAVDNVEVVSCRVVLYRRESHTQKSQARRIDTTTESAKPRIQNWNKWMDSMYKGERGISQMARRVM